MSQPVSGTYEWASHNVNCVSGCSNNCLYCYAKAAAIKNGRKTPDNWHVEEINDKAWMKNYKKRKGTIMFPSTHDITPNNLRYCLVVLERLLNMGNKVLIVSKPHIECISSLCANLGLWRDNILFRFTIGSCSNRILKFWEPSAPPYMDRIASLVLAYRKGFQTSVSSEPYLDAQIETVVEQTMPYITDAIWIGKANNLIYRLTTNGANEEILKWGKVLEEFQNDENVKLLYNKLKDNPKVKWKDSIKKIVGLERPTEKGLDI
jgi:DNA repair photolyase